MTSTQPQETAHTEPIGFLNLNKPAGLTSHDCVSQIRRIFKTRKVGHGGTLDPAATGVLPIALGKATRFLSFLSGTKRYRATFQLGQTSATDDATGDLLSSIPCPQLTLEQVQKALEAYQGSIEQVPPIYSAIRQDGKRLYQWARAGATLEDLTPSPRTVWIHQLHILAWRPGEFPELDLDIMCGAGTYIRALARDLGHQLGSGGLMSHLTRTQSGPFELDTSVTLNQIQLADDPLQNLQPIAAGLRNYPEVVLDATQTQRWQYGQALKVVELKFNSDPTITASWIRVYGDQHQFLGLGHLEELQLKPLRVLT